METGNDKPLSMGAGVETSEIWSLKSVPEICGASWSGIETIMKADVSLVSPGLPSEVLVCEA